MSTQLASLSASEAIEQIEARALSSVEWVHAVIESAERGFALPPFD